MKKNNSSGTNLTEKVPIKHFLSIMRTTFILLFTCVFCTMAEMSYTQNARVTINKRNVALKEVLNDIEKQTDYLFIYNNEVNTNEKVSVRANQKAVSNVLTSLLKDKDLDYSMEGNHIILTVVDKSKLTSEEMKIVAQQQKKTITGTVTDKNGEPIIGANIIESGTTNGTVTDIDGNFSLSVEDNAFIRISYIGYLEQNINTAKKTHHEVILEEDTQALDELVVVGYGVMKRSDLTGAVASVKTEELNNIPVANIMNALSGKIAGIDVGPVTRPGGSPSVLIRGRRSINADNSPLYVVDGIPKNSIDDIPVSEIQNIEVLKDAVSASIYGSRGANGVILITTKGGNLSQEKTTINFDAFYGLNMVKLPDLMDGNEYISYRRDRARFDAYRGIGWDTGAPLNDDQTFDAKELGSVNNNIFTDWKKLLYKESTASQEYNLSIETSGVKNNGRFSIGFRDDEGYYPNNGARRLSLGLRQEQRIFNFLKIGINARYTNLVQNDVEPGVMQSSGTVTYNALTYLNPLIRAYDDDGNLIENVINIYANPLLDFNNPYQDKLTYHRLFGVASLYADLFKGMTFNSNFGYEIDNRLGDVFYGKNTTKRYIVRDSEGAYAEKNNSFNTDLTWDNILNYTQTFQKHNVNATGVASLQKGVNKYFQAKGTGLPDDGLGNWNLSELTGNIRNESSYSQKTIASLIGRFQYGYDNRYLLNFSIRSDGASVLAPGNKWATFPAISGAWIINNEDFYKSNVLTSLKVRLSYGSVGNAAINPYETFAGTKARRTNFGNTLLTGYMLDGLVNKSLGWEISKTTNVGLDWGLFRGRINGYIDAYRTYTSDLLFMRSLPNLSGSTEIWQNIGETSNIGLELSINSTNITTKDFKWQTDINYSFNKSKIEKLITSEDMPNNNLFIGKPLRVYNDYILDGIWQVSEVDEAKKYGTYPGYQKLKDIAGPDGEGADGSISSTFDKKILGQRDPSWMAYMRNSFTYQNLSLSFTMNGKFGHMIQMAGTGWSSALPLKLLNDYWTPDNPNGKYPLMALSTTNTLDGLWRYRKGDYIVMQEISLAYRFKLKPLNNVNVSFLAHNPFFIYRAAKDCIDPMSPSSDWTVWKSYALKFNVTF
ncbi:TonB-dependent receptor [Proteiniphilum sp. UBA1028]|jgi:TonB-linked SusC/RagA family outer membrane protein|uniref:TonB-dependent receptor n=1 Tax=Proteiniphilum sp. UBA1028 TaxID=1947251 RepID=UPI000EE948ED|nr:TonB-dependent receptor [Proteiniphilum sp. UBA1028]HCF80346.1 hypothetical protein [Porphyromonadaceae bacterium]